MTVQRSNKILLLAHFGALLLIVPRSIDAFQQQPIASRWLTSTISKQDKTSKRYYVALKEQASSTDATDTTSTTTAASTDTATTRNNTNSSPLTNILETGVPVYEKDENSQSVMDLSMDWIEDIRSEAAVMEESSPGSTEDASGLLWRGVVVVLCALWASNFAAIKLVVAEPGMFRCIRLS